MEPIMPTMSKEDFDAAMHDAVSGVILAVRAGWKPDVSARSDVRNDRGREGDHRVIVERSVVIAVRTEITDDDDGGVERILTPAFGTELTKTEALALSVLFDNKPAWALADYLQEEGLIPEPRESVERIVEKLIFYARHKRHESSNGKFRGMAMDNQAWTVVEGLLSEVASKLAAGEDVYDWK